jgi:hypothetical protein
MAKRWIGEFEKAKSDERVIIAPRSYIELELEIDPAL